MSIPFAIAIYFVIWWTVLFAVLPWGLRTQHEAGDVVPGTPRSAPARTRALRVILMTSVVAAVLFGAGYGAFALKLIDLRPPPPPPVWVAGSSLPI